MEKKYLILIINSIIFVNLITFIISSTCINKERPFLKNRQCVSYCSKEELKSEICIIDEETVKINI